MPNKILEPDICIIGGGVGGLTMASVSAQLGLDVVLFEGHKMGGDCLNVGCVPSKSILAAGHAAFTARKEAQKFGIDTPPINVDMQAVHDHIHGVIKNIEPHDSPERFESMGVTVIQDYAAFTSPNSVEGGGYKIKARKYLIATGSVPFVPPIDGIENVEILTNENIFELTELPEHLIVIGGGPIGCELSQAFKNLGSKVSIISMSPIFPHDDPEAVEVIRNRLLDDGIEIYEEAQTKTLSKDQNQTLVTIETKNGDVETLKGSHILVATGQIPNIDKLNLDKAGVIFNKKGIDVSNTMQTSNRNIFAVGDCTGAHQFTHMAEYQTSIVIQKAIFKSPFAKANYDAVPWVTYTSPEVANIGLNEPMAEEKFGKGNFEIARFNYADNDRARSERATEGFIKVIATSKGRVLGATIVGKNAGELILPWSLAITQKLKLKDIAGQIVPYPTYNEISKRAAGSFYKDKLFAPLTKKIVGFLKHF